MPLRPQLWTIGGLATELGRTTRVMAKALAHVAPDGKASGHAAWFMQTALAALAEYEKGSRHVASMRGHNGTKSSYATTGASEDALLDAVEAGNENVEAFLRRLRAAPNAERRREILQAEGVIVGEFDRALQAHLEQHEIGFALRPFFENAMRALIGEIVSLCALKIVPERAVKGKAAGARP